jgi:hypothetical protein
VTAPTVSLSLSPEPTSVTAKTSAASTYIVTNTYSIIDSTTPTLSILSNEAGTYSINSCGVSTSGAIAANTAVTVKLSVSDMASTSNTCVVTVTDSSGNAGSNSLSFSADATAPTADFYLQSYFGSDPSNFTNAAGSGTNDNTSTTALNARISNIADPNGVGVKAYYLSASSSAPAATSTDWVIATETSLSPSDNYTRLNSDTADNVTLSDSVQNALGTTDNASLTVYLHLLDFAGNVRTINDSIFLVEDNGKPTFNDFTIEDPGTGVDNASLTNSATVTLRLDAYDNASGVYYVYATEQTEAQAATIINSLTEADNFTTYFKAVTASGNNDNISTYSYTFDNTTVGEKTVRVYVADKGKNVASDNGSDTIYLDNVAPTIDNATVTGNATSDNMTELYGDSTTNATSGDAAYTDNRTVTIQLGYGDANTKVFQYHISEDATVGSQYVDNVTGALSDNGTYVWDGSRNNPDNLTVPNQLTRTVWSVLDNETTDNASTTYYVTDNHTSSDNGSNEVDYNFSSDGSKTLTISIKDAANNITTTTRSIVVDTTAPTTKSGYSLSFVDNASASSPTTISYTNTLTLQISDSVLDNLFTDTVNNITGVGVHAVYLTDDNTTPTSSDNFTHLLSGSTGTTVTVTKNSAGNTPGPGDNLTLYAYGIDRLGNGDNGTGEGFSDVISAVIVFDNATPEQVSNIGITTAGVENPANDNETFYTQGNSVSLDVTGKVNDNTTLTYYATTGTSVSATSLPSASVFSSTLSAITLDSDDNTTIQVFAKDSANNIAWIDNLTVISDDTAPIIDNITLVGSTSGADNTTDTDNTTLKILFGGAVDNQSTVNAGIYKYYASQDNVTPASSASGWSSAWNGTDNGTITITSAGPGSQTVYVWVMDQALNISSPSVYDAINVLGDTSLPVVTSVSAGNVAPALSAATYTNSDNVSVTITAQDNESAVVSYLINEDNVTPASSASGWDNFTTPGANITSNVVYYTFDNSTDGVKNLYVFVKNAQDNVSLSGFDNITLDDTAPDNSSAPTLTGQVDGDNNTSYTDDNVTLDNLTNWITDTGSGIATGQYFITDNSSLTPTYATSGWRDLDNLVFNIGDGAGELGNSTVGMKNIYIFAKDNASNVSSPFSASIYFDNVSPDNLAFTLSDMDSSGGSTSYDQYYTNSDNITVGSLSALDNASGVTGSGPAAYLFTDNASFTPLDNDSGWLSASPYWVKLDNATNARDRTIYGWVKDFAGKVSSSAVMDNITFDNATPAIDNLTLRPDVGFQYSDVRNGNVTLYLSANDNGSLSPDNFSSGLKDFYITYVIHSSYDGGVLAGGLDANNDNVSSASNWIPFTSLKDNNTANAIASDNYSFDNASYVLTFSATSNLSKNLSGANNNDNLTVVFWLRDNASNISGNVTTVISLDNSTIYYDR